MFVAGEALGLVILILDKAWQSCDTDRNGRTPESCYQLIDRGSYWV